MGYFLGFGLGVINALLWVSLSTTPQQYAQAEQLCAANGGMKTYRLAVWDDPSVTCNNDGKFSVRVAK